MSTYVLRADIIDKVAVIIGKLQEGKLSRGKLFFGCHITVQRKQSVSGEDSNVCSQ